MIVLTQKRIENFSAGIICAVPLFIFCPTKFPRLMRTIAKSIAVGYSIFSTCVLHAQTSTSEFEDLIVEYEPSLLGSSYTPFQAEQFNSYIGQGISQSLDRIVQFSTLATATITTIYLEKNINDD